MGFKNALWSGGFIGIFLFLVDIITDRFLFSSYFSGSLWQSMGALYYVKALLFSVVIGIFFIFFYVILYDALPGTKDAQKALLFGILFWAIGVLPSSLLFELQTTVANPVIMYWLLKGLVKYVIAGYLIPFFYH